MKSIVTLITLLVLMCYECLAQCPPNIGFEDGAFGFWECYYGKGNNARDFQYAFGLTGQMTNIHTIYSKAASQNEEDEYGGFPVVCPNGSGYSVKLGNNFTGGQTSRITYTYNIPPGREFKLIMNYAVVLQNPTHSLQEQPKFTTQIFNVTDNAYVDCPSFNFEASSSLPGFELSTAVVGGERPASVYYKKWAGTTINLTHYAGKTVRLEFTAYDCIPGGHFGYAYLDIDSDCGSGISGNIYCKNQESTTLLAPIGFSDYDWYNADLSEKKGTGQALTLKPVPPAGTKYAVIVRPYLGIGCTDTLYTTLGLIDKDFAVAAVDTVYGCPDLGADITAAYVTAGSSKNLKFTYFQNVTDNAYLYKPEAITTSGTYYIKGQNDEGCQAIVAVPVVISQPELSVKNGTTVTFPTTVDLSRLVKKNNGYTYNYFYDSNATSAITNYETINKSGTYFIKCTNAKGCELVKPVSIIIMPPPPFVINAPSVFTPNGDGINDHFSVKLEGEVGFGNVKIFDRGGSLLYMISAPGGYWDGTYNGRTLPAGTYYWIFEGTDKYYRNKVNKGSFISLLR